MNVKLNLNIKIILLILAFSSITGIVFNIYSSRGIPLFKDPRTVAWARDAQLFDIHTLDSLQNTVPTISSAHTAPENEIKDNPAGKYIPKAVNVKQAFTLFTSGKAVFIDARDKWDYGEGHIKGSINIPYYKFEKNDNSLKNIDKSSIIITYCDGDDCEMSKKLAESLWEIGYANVYYFFGGWKGWLKAQYPTENSEVE